MKKKGKVHPSPLPPSNGDDRLSVLKLLPTVILVLVSALSAKDREVLAYLITRSLNTTTITTNISSKKKRNHKVPVFDCECFDCYTSYWSIWDSSPNRELIHQIIEAFEDHLTTGDNSSSQTSNGRRKKKESSGRPKEPMAKNIRQPVKLTVVSDEGMPEKPPVLPRKMLPDVLGIFNSRFWSLWNSNA